jgi:hypothetical protein
MGTPQHKQVEEHIEVTIDMEPMERHQYLQSLFFVGTSRYDDRAEG